jgi:hypothetical protein
VKRTFSETKWGIFIGDIPQTLPTKLRIISQVVNIMLPFDNKAVHYQKNKKGL